MENKQGYHLFDFERSKFWKNNQNGYTHELLEAGLYDYEDAVKILKDSNLICISTEMVHHSNLKRLSSIQNEQGEKEKRSMFDTIETFTKETLSTNPMGQIEAALFNEGHYLEEQNYQHISYNSTQRYTLIPEMYKEGLNVVIERKDNGRYEVLANRITLNAVKKSENELKRKQSINK
jgi:hypothetical protein